VLWTVVAKRSDDTAFATHRTSSRPKARRVRLAGAVHNLTDLPAVPMIAKRLDC
jgi:hypothetical protein